MTLRDRGRAFRITAVSPVLAVNDLESEIGYYIDRLGFELNWRWSEPDGPAVRAGVGLDGCELQLVADGRFAPAGPSYVYWTVSRVDELYRNCLQFGAHIVMEIGDRSFGVRDFRVRDLSGNMLGFGEPT